MRSSVLTAGLALLAVLAMAACDSGSGSSSSSATASTVSMTTTSNAPPRTPGVPAGDSVLLSGAVSGQLTLQDVHCGINIPQRGISLQAAGTLSGQSYTLDIDSMYGQVEISVAQLRPDLTASAAWNTHSAKGATYDPSTGATTDLDLTPGMGTTAALHVKATLHCP